MISGKEIEYYIRKYDWHANVVVFQIFASQIWKYTSKFVI